MNDDKAQGHEPRSQGPDSHEARSQGPDSHRPRSQGPDSHEAARGQDGHAPDHAVSPMTRRDTRARIQRVALELFAEQGYEATSLREIAERLEVTKAALYYHFKSKEDIVRSLVEDYFAQLDELQAWAATQPRTPQTRAAVLRKYVRIVADGHGVFRMLHQNQAAVNSLASAKKRTGDVFRERMGGLVAAITGPDADLPERLRAAMILGSVSIGWMSFADQVDDRDKLSALVLDIATDFAGAFPPDH